VAAARALGDIKRQMPDDDIVNTGNQMLNAGWSLAVLATFPEG
jgi:hypothetical protein